MLTKEECMKTFYRFKVGRGTPKDMNLFDRLINEHFDNPPLKFEELKEGMWVWDIKNAGWVCFDRPIANVAYCKMLSGLVIFFEENRFYRKQVQEDE